MIFKGEQVFPVTLVSILLVIAQHNNPTKNKQMNRQKNPKHQKDSRKGIDVCQKANRIIFFHTFPLM